MQTYEDLQLANNLESLDLLAKQKIIKNFASKKFETMCTSLDKLYKETQQNPLDQEKTYVILSRFFYYYEIFLQKQPDKKFTELRFGSEYKRAKIQFEEVKRSLIKRYELKNEKLLPTPPPEIIPINTVNQKRIFQQEFITCPQLYSALKADNNLLLVDARPSLEFLESRIDLPNCINVPNECISVGLSANKLGEKLSEKTREIWEKRDTFGALVLFDYNSTSDNLLSTKLRALRSALVDWDPNKKYNEPPVILNGGYLELLMVYPSLCTNAQIVLSRRDNELDELLDIDNIEYPTEGDSRANVMGSIETKLENGEEEATRDSLIEENKKLSLDKQEIRSQLMNAEQEWMELNEKIKNETEINKIHELKEKADEREAIISNLERTLEEVSAKKDETKEKFDLYAKFDPENETFNTEQLKEIIEIEENDKEKTQILDAIAEERYKALQQARALKPKPEQVAIKPMINRNNKPSNQLRISTHHVGPLETVTMMDVNTNCCLVTDGCFQQTPGHVGLKNIRNTCYMNTVVQCVRNIDSIREVFCKGIYAKYEIRSPAALILETAYLIRYLWSRAVKYIEPNDFYRKVCTLEPSYALGNHEDCMEFFLFLLNHLSEDCYYEAEHPAIMTTRQKAWYNQFQGKSSIFIDLFYHQIRIKQFCTSCLQSTYKFEIESTFMLSVPDHDFTIENLVDEYMSDFIIPEYCCSKCKKPVTNIKNICYQPPVVVIVLKRYKQVVHNGVVTISKIESKGRFPKTNFKLGDCMYDLNSIAMHSGDMNHGHYTAACLTQNGWYEFNDEIVRPININDDSIRIKACAFFYSMCDDSKRRG